MALYDKGNDHFPIKRILFNCFHFIEDDHWKILRWTNKDLIQKKKCKRIFAVWYPEQVMQCDKFSPMFEVFILQIVPIMFNVLLIP